MLTVQLSRPDHPDDPTALTNTLREIVLSGRWPQGEFAMSFERQVAETCGSIYAVATNSGTSALEAICAAAGLGKGTEVICPSYTFVATINAVLECGATPVFADIDRKTFALDLQDVERKLTDRTRAVLLVHQFGIPADGKAFASFCQRHSLTLIEDAACGLGSRHDGKALGTFGIAGILSFHPRKVISTGEGGMVLTDHSETAMRARRHGNHGRNSVGKATAEYAGHNHRMSEFQAALGLWAMERLPEAMARRQAIAQSYEEALSGHPQIRLVHEPARGEWNHQSYPILLPQTARDQVIAELGRRGIEASPGPVPAHTHPYLVALLRPARLPHTEAAHAETVLLPMYAAFAKEQQNHVIASLREILKNVR